MKKIGMGVLLVVCVAFSGCFNKRTDYQKLGQEFDAEKRNEVRMGAGREEVVAILGEPHAVVNEKELNREELIYYFEENSREVNHLWVKGVTTQQSAKYKQLTVVLYRGEVTKIEYTANSLN